jgi:hypothetical protein
VTTTTTIGNSSSSSKIQQRQQPQLIIDDNTENEVLATNRIPFLWVSDWNAMFLDRVTDEIIFTEIPLDDNESSLLSVLRCVDISATSYRRSTELLNENNSFNNNNNPSNARDLLKIWDDTIPSRDIITGIYEGGNTIWECSLDLVHYFVQENIILGRNDTCIELGCGHALPSCYLLRKALLQYYADGTNYDTDNIIDTNIGIENQHQNTIDRPSFYVTVTDYNEPVIIDATISNFLLNTAGCNIDPKTVLQHHIKAGAGDWMDMSNNYLRMNNTIFEQDQYETYDIIIASETLYTIQSCYETALLIYRHLTPMTGRAYIATKRYYFGVGGGTDCFRTYCEEISSSNIINNHNKEHEEETVVDGINTKISTTTYQLHLNIVQVYDNGTGNIREIIQVTKIYK